MYLHALFPCVFYCFCKQLFTDILAAKTLVYLGMIDIDPVFAGINVRHLGNAYTPVTDNECPTVASLNMLDLHIPITSSQSFEAKRCYRGCSSSILMKMKLYDITVTISAKTPIYKGDPGVDISSFKAIAKGDSANVSHVAFGVHTATHVDAPNHFIDGARRGHELDPEKLIGPCRVIDIADDVVAIEPEHVGDIAGVTRVLFKTQNSSFWATPERGFRSDYSYLTPATAKLLVDNGIVLVGIDYLSIEKSGSPGHPVHITLLEKEVVILEGVDLREVPAGDYDLLCAPLKYDGATGDGAPARTFLREI